MKREFFLVLALIVIYCTCAAIDLTKVNFRHKFDPDAPITVSSKLTTIHNSIRIHFAVNLLNDTDSLLQVNLYLQSGYDDISESANTPIVKTDSFKKVAGALWYVHTFDPNSSANLVVISIVCSDLKTYNYDIPFSNTIRFPLHNFSLMSTDSAYFLSPFIEDERLIFRDSSLTIFQYSPDFQAASPPMTMTKVVSKNMEIDTVFLSKQQLSPVTGKLYFLQNDTSSLAGMAVLGVPLLYPRLISVEDLVKPLIYVSTKTEYDGLLSAKNKKTELDKFWIQATGDRTTAATTIRKFYRRVNEANKFFTTYKQGWKTDRGMIYMLYGVPTRINKTMLSEEWVYENGEDEAVNFTFNRLKNFFSPEHYELERKLEYGDLWFMQVDLWRKGRI